MKKLILISGILAVFVLTGCKEKKEPTPENCTLESLAESKGKDSEVVRLKFEEACMAAKNIDFAKADREKLCLPRETAEERFKQYASRDIQNNLRIICSLYSTQEETQAIHQRMNSMTHRRR